MIIMLQVTYFHHSGFMVETEKHCLIFDYFTENEKYNFINISKYSDKKIFVFVSHFHQDHYDRVIFEWQKTIPEIQILMNKKLILVLLCLYFKRLLAVHYLI